MSLTNSLGQRNLALAVREASFEMKLADHDLVELSFESTVARLERVAAAIESVHNLSNMMFRDRVGDLTLEHVEMYELSVESIFRACGEPIPLEDFVPSFESSADYSTETEKKVGSGLRRLLDWLIKAISNLGSNLKLLFQSYVGSADRRAAAVAARRAKKAEKTGNSSEENITLKDTVWLNNGGISAVVALLHKAEVGAKAMATDVEKTINIVVEELATLENHTSFETGKGAAIFRGIFNRIGATQHAGSYERKYYIFPDYGLTLALKAPRVDIGKEHMVTKMEVFEPEKVSKEMPRLAHHDIIGAYAGVEEFMKSKPMADAIKASGDKIEGLRSKALGLGAKPIDGPQDPDRFHFYHGIALMLLAIAQLPGKASRMTGRIENVVTAYAGFSE